MSNFNILIGIITFIKKLISLGFDNLEKLTLSIKNNAKFKD